MPPMTSVRPTAMVATSPTRTRTVHGRQRRPPSLPVPPFLLVPRTVESQAVTNATDRLDDRARAAGVELSSQVANIDLDHICVRVLGIAPNVLQQIGLGDD